MFFSLTGKGVLTPFPVGHGTAQRGRGRTPGWMGVLTVKGRVQPSRELFDFDRSITAYSSNEAMSSPVKKESDAKHNDGCLCGTSKFQDAVMPPTIHMRR